MPRLDAASRQARSLAVGVAVAFTPFAAGQQRPEPAPPTAAADAGPLYDLALEALRQRFAVGADQALELPMPDRPEDQVLPLVERRFAAPGWAAAVARAGPALDLFAQAAQLPRCTFGPGPEPLLTGYDARSLQLLQLGELVAARAWQRLPRQPDAAVAAAVSLLRHARHVLAQPTSRALPFASHSEQLAAGLLRAVLRTPADDAGEPLEPAQRARIRARTRAELEQHLATRPTLRELADGLADELRRFAAAFTGATGAAADEPAADGANDVRAGLLREHGAAIEARIGELAEEALAPLRRAERPDTATLTASADAFVARLREGTGREELQRALPAMTAERAVELLARQLALLCLPDIAGLAAIDDETRALLRTCLSDAGG